MLIIWLAARVRLKPAMVWALLGLVGCVWVWGLVKFRRAWLNEFAYLTTAGLVNLTLRCWFAGEATRQLADERKAGTLELLLSTPLDVPDILRGQRLALARQFAKPAVVIVIAEILFMWGTISAAWATGDQLRFWVLLWFAGM